MAVWTNSFTNNPPDSQDHGRGGERIRETRSETLARFQAEHDVGNATTNVGYDDTGRHSPGSARAFVQNASPSQLLRPDEGGPAQVPAGSAALDGTDDDKGRLWADQSGYQQTFRYLTDRAAISWAGVHPHRNWIMNGSTQIWQRNPSSAITCTAGAETFTADRWYVNPTGGNATVQRTASSAAGWTAPRTRWVMGINGAAGPVTNIVVGTRILSSDAAKLCALNGTDGNVVFSFRLANDSATSAAAVTPTVTVSSTNISNTWNLGAGATVVPRYTTPLGALADGSDAYYTFSFDLRDGTMGADADNGLEIEISFAGTFAAGDTLYLSEVQLESGPATVRTPFVEPDFDDELRQCQRFYEKSFPYGATPAHGLSETGCIMGLVGTTDDPLNPGTVIATQVLALWPFRESKFNANYTMTFYTPVGAGPPGVFWDFTINAVTTIQPGAANVWFGGRQPDGEHSAPITNAAATAPVAGQAGHGFGIHATAEIELT